MSLQRSIGVRLGACLQGAGLSLLLCLLPAVQAAVRELPPGAAVALSPSQGLLALAVDSSLPIEQVQVRPLRSGRAGRIELDALPAGRRIALFVVDAGRYRWFGVRERDQAVYPLGDDPEFVFEVRPGVLNYPGDLVFRPRGTRRAVLHLANRALGIIDHVATAHPALAALPFHHAGHYPDPFPAFYRSEAGDDTALVPPRTAAVPSFDSPPIAVDELWREPAVQRVALSPDGRWLARHSLIGDCASIELIDLRDRSTRVVAELSTVVRELGWASDHQLVVGSGRRELHRVDIYSIHDRGERVQIDRLQLPHRGYVVDLLPLVPDRLLFARRIGDRTAVHRLDIASQAALDRFDYAWEQRLNRAIDGDFLWLSDGRGRLRAAQAADPHGASVLYHGDGAAFAAVLRGHDENGFQPIQLSADGALIYGLSEAGREQRELVALDPRNGRMTTLFGRAGVDIVAPVFDLERRVIGASYVENGHVATAFLDPADRGLDAALQRHFPGRSVRLLDRDRSGRHLIIAVEATDQPEMLHHYDRERDRATLIESARPWLAGRRLASSEVLRSHSVDGLGIESYLTMPVVPDDRPRPLIVMPHGGPIGIRNLRQFDPEVQFLASLGYAVLQVNYRGSAGFGRAFREAGHAQLGTLIENDIDSAIRHALQQRALDPQRICVLGSSYGGYSAMMMALRWPGRFRCAVSIAGFSDRLLQFTASDSGRSPEVRRILETFMGDPDTEFERMQATSPLYRYRELDLPLLLAHGTEDLRVDYEQTRRLVRMLNLAGREPVLLPLYGEGHSIEMRHNRVRLWHAVAGFLRTHLDGADPQPVAGVSGGGSRLPTLH